MTEDKTPTALGRKKVADTALSRNKELGSPLKRGATAAANRLYATCSNIAQQHSESNVTNTTDTNISVGKPTHIFSPDRRRNTSKERTAVGSANYTHSAARAGKPRQTMLTLKPENLIN